MEDASRSTTARVPYLAVTGPPTEAAAEPFDPWGNVTGTNNGSFAGLLGYQSAWTDPAAGKALMGARRYDPGAGDFTSADTLQVSPDPDPVAGNPFAYAADEPLDLTDPTGHCIFCLSTLKSVAHAVVSAPAA
jgi:RHS repeat-associated protein